MSRHSPSPNQTTPRRRRDGLAPLVLLALILAVLPIGCTAELALRLITPNNDPFKDVGSSTGLGAYQPFPPGISFAAVDPNLGNLQQTEIARREQTPVGVGGAVTVAPVAEVGPPAGATIPPMATATTQSTPRPTTTPELSPTNAAGGGLPSPTPTNAVIIPGLTATPAPSETPTRTPTFVPTESVSPAPTTTATSRPIVGTPATAVPPSASPTLPPSATATTIITVEPPSPTRTATPRPLNTLTPTAPVVSPPPSTASPTVSAVVPSETPTRTPIVVNTPTATSTFVPIDTPTTTNTPVPPTITVTSTPEPPTATNTPELPTATVTNTPEPPTATVTNTPVPPPEVSINSASLTEGDSGTQVMSFTVSLSVPATSPVSVDWATAAATSGNIATPGADFVGASGTVNFAIGQQQQFVDVAIAGDTIVEADETFLVNLSNPVNAVIVNGSGVGTILDNDFASASLSPLARSVIEGNSGTTPASFTVTLAQPAERNVVVRYATANGTGQTGAVAGGANGDYVAAGANASVTIPAGATSANFNIAVRGDVRFEQDEIFYVDLVASTRVTFVGPTRATVTILNDDQLSLSINNVAVTERNTGDTPPIANFTVTLNGTSLVTVTVDFSTAGTTATAGSDFLETTGTLIFPPGSTTSQIPVTVLPDNIDELNETFTVTLANPTGGAVIGDGSGTGTITDDDNSTVRFSTAGVSVNEGDSGTTAVNLTVQLDAAAERTVALTYRTQDDTATTADSDYGGVGSGGISFAPGQTSQTITVNVTGDTVVELDERFFVQLVAGADVILGAPSTAEVIITNDDIIDVTLSGGQSVTEGNAGEQVVNLTLNLSSEPAVGQPVTIDVTTGGTATAGSDYTIAPTQLIFVADDPQGLSRTIQVRVQGDLLNENNETAIITVTPTGWATNCVVCSQTITITNDDFPTVSVTNAPQVLEGNPGDANSLLFTLALSSPAPFPVTVRASTFGLTATGGTDYDTVTSQLVTFPANSVAPQTVEVDVTADLDIEADEQLALQLSNPTNAVLGSNGVGTILDDDQAQITFSKDGDERDGGVPGLDGIEWTITITNSGTTAANLVVRDQLPGNPPGPMQPSGSPLLLDASLGADPTYSSGDNTVNWSGSLPANTTMTISIGVVYQDPGTCTSVSNPRVDVTANGFAYAPLTNQGAADLGATCPIINSPVLNSPQRQDVPDDDASPSPTPLPTPTATSTSTPTRTPQPTDTPTVAPTDTPRPTRTATAEPTETAKPTRTATAEPTDTPKPTRTATAEPSDTPRPTRTATAEPTDTPRPTRTATAEPTDTPEPTETAKPTRTATAEPTDTPEPTETAKPTRTATAEPTDAPAPTKTPKPTAEPTDTPEPTAKPTDTPEPTETAAPTSTEEPTAKPSETAAPTRTTTPEPTPTDEAPPDPYPAPSSQSDAVSTMGLGGSAVAPFGLLAMLLLVALRKR
jgi:hypothetical protein